MILILVRGSRAQEGLLNEVQATSRVVVQPAKVKVLTLQLPPELLVTRIEVVEGDAEGELARVREEVKVKSGVQEVVGNCVDHVAS